MVNPESNQFNFVEGDYIIQRGSFRTGVDKSKTVYHAGAVSSNLKNVVYSQQDCVNYSQGMTRFLEDLLRDLPSLNLDFSTQDKVKSNISNLQHEIRSSSPNLKKMKSAIDVLHGILVEVAGNLATRFIENLTHLNF